MIVFVSGNTQVVAGRPDCIVSQSLVKGFGSQFQVVMTSSLSWMVPDFYQCKDVAALLKAGVLNLIEDVLQCYSEAVLTHRA